MMQKVPPMTLALPGPVDTVVTPAFKDTFILGFDRVDRPQFGMDGIVDLIVIRAFVANAFFGDAHMAMGIDDSRSHIVFLRIDDLGGGIVLGIEMTDCLDRFAFDQDIGDFVIEGFHGEQIGVFDEDHWNSSFP
jgi:hypothetical protein